MYVKYAVNAGNIHTVSTEMSPLNILQQQAETCTDLNEILYIQCDIYDDLALFKIWHVRKDKVDFCKTTV